MSFVQSTAYVGEFRHLGSLAIDARFEPSDDSRDEIQVVKLRREDISRPDIAQLAGAIGLSPESTAFTAWNPTDDATYRTDNNIPAAIAFDPQPGDTLRISDSEAWVITSAKHHPNISQWTLVASKERVNEPA